MTKIERLAAAAVASRNRGAKRMYVAPGDVIELIDALSAAVQIFSLLAKAKPVLSKAQLEDFSKRIKALLKEEPELRSNPRP